MYRMSSLCLAFFCLATTVVHAMETEEKKNIFQTKNGSLGFNKIFIDKTIINEAISNQQQLEFEGDVTVTNDAFSFLKNEDQKEKYSVELSSSRFILKKDEENRPSRLQIFSDTLSENLVAIIDNLDDKISFSIILRNNEKVAVDEEFIKKIAKKNWHFLHVCGKFFMKDEAVIELNKHAVTDVYIKEDEISFTKTHEEFSSFWYEREDKFPDELLLAAVKSPNLARIIIEGAYPSLETLTILAKEFGFDRIYLPKDYHTQHQAMLSDFAMVKIYEEFNILRKNYLPEISKNKE